MILHITSQKSSFLLKKFSGEPRYGLGRLLLLYFENLEIFEAAQRLALARFYPPSTYDCYPFVFHEYRSCLIFSPGCRSADR